MQVDIYWAYLSLVQGQEYAAPTERWTCFASLAS